MSRAARVAAILASTLACAACARAEGDVTLSFVAEQVQAGSEDYLCFTFDGTDLAGRAVERIAWSAPEGGGVSLHHATLYAMTTPFPDGPFSCLYMPGDAVGLHVWAPGGDALVMPAGLGLAIPEGTTKLVVQAHVLRTSAAPAAEASAVLGLASGAPERLAAWHSTFTDVPPIPPHEQVSASSLCRARTPVHAIFAWPHMHRLGVSFHGAVRRAGGGAVPLVDVTGWDVARERTYPVAVDVEAGDLFETMCTWENPGAEVVQGGLHTTDEMCSLGVVSWPADAPRCEPL